MYMYLFFTSVFALFYYIPPPQFSKFIGGAASIKYWLETLFIAMCDSYLDQVFKDDLQNKQLHVYDIDCILFNAPLNTMSWLWWCHAWTAE